MEYDKTCESHEQLQKTSKNWKTIYGKCLLNIVECNKNPMDKIKRLFRNVAKLALGDRAKYITVQNRHCTNGIESMKTLNHRNSPQ